MTTRTTRPTVPHKHAPWVSTTPQRQSNDDALTWLLICKHLIAVISLKMFTSRQVKCGILVSCSRVEHSVDFTTAAEKGPAVSASVARANLCGSYADFSPVSCRILNALSRIEFQRWKSSSAADFLFLCAVLHPRPRGLLSHPPCCHLYRNRLKVWASKSTVAHFNVLLYNRWLYNNSVTETFLKSIYSNRISKEKKKNISSPDHWLSEDFVVSIQTSEDRQNGLSCSCSYQQADTKITDPHIPHVGINLLVW